MNGDDFLTVFLLATLCPALVVLQLPLLHTRMTPVSLLDPSVNLVQRQGLHIHAETSGNWRRLGAARWRVRR